MGVIPVPYGVRSKKKKSRTILAKNAPAQNDLIGIKTGQNCSSHACARIKRLVITPPRGVIPPLRGGKGAGKPKADRATANRNVT